MPEILPVTKECRCLCEIGRAGDLGGGSVIDIQDCEEGEMGATFFTVPRHQINSSEFLYCPLSVFLRIQNPDLGVIEFRIV